MREFKKIKDVSKYRGFYLVDDKGNMYADDGRFHNSKLEVKYSRGFKLSHGENSVEHIYNKLLAKIQLTKNERKEFEEKVSPTGVIVRVNGDLYNFAKVLEKLPILNAFVVDRKNITRHELDRLQEKFSYCINEEELIKISKEVC